MRGNFRKAVITEPGRIELREDIIPTPGPNEVLVQVRACAICTFDQRIFKGEWNVYPTLAGHESSGVIVETGEEVSSSYSVGKKVSFLGLSRCWACRSCRRGFDNICDQPSSLGNTDPLQRPAGFAEYACLPYFKVFTVSDDTSFEHAALVEPVACVSRSIERLNIGPGENVLIFGAGIMGMLHTIMARRRGAYVIVAEPDDGRRKKALDFGASTVVDPKSSDFQEIIEDATHGYGAEKIAVATSVVDALELAVKVASKGAVINCYASFHPRGISVSFDPGIVHEKEVTITGTKSQSLRDVQRAADIVSTGLPQLSELIQRTWKLDDIQAAFEETVKGGIYRTLVLM